MAGNLTNMIASIFSGSAVTADPYYEYTTLLLPGSGTNGAQNNTFLDGSTNNFTITRNGNTTQGTFSPFSQTGWGNYFDGTGDYLATPTGQTPLTLNTDDFTLECWYYLPTQVQANTSLISSSNSSSITNALLVQLNTSTNAWELYVNGTNLLASASGRSATLNTWQHIAITRSGSTFTFYLNGVAATGVSTSSASISVANWLIGYWYLSSHALTGYISNLRIVKGVVVYTGAFTPPTSPLAATQSAGTNISAITGTQTSLLTCQSNRFIDNSTNNFTITRNGDTRVVAFSPFNPTASWSAATYGGSGYFDGSGDYLNSIGTTSNWAFMSNTTALSSIELWYYPLSSATQYLIQTNGATSTNIGFDFSKTSSNTLNFRITYGSAGNFIVNGTTTGTVTINQWNHVLITYDQSLSTQNLKVYINGGSAETFNKTGNTPSSSNPANALWISGYTSSVTDWANGYISSLRISNVVRSSSVPTIPYTSDTNTSLLLNFTNAGIYDATSKNDLETVDGAQISNTTAKWGSTSIKFDGTGDRLQIPDNNLFTLGSGDFTIEFWAYTTTTNNQTVIIQIDSGGSTTALSFGVQINTSKWRGILASGSTFYSVTSSANAIANQWNHIAFVRNGNTGTLYINGTADGTVSLTGVTINDSSQVVSIGGEISGSTMLNGYLQDLRITKGYARYVTGTGANAGKMVFNGTNDLALPTAAFPTL